MQLENKNAIIYGASGAIGSTVAQAFAREGAKVFLTGRNAGSLQAVADLILSAGGSVEINVVDATDESAIEAHFAAVVEKVGKVDISINAVGIKMTGAQGIPLVKLTPEQLLAPINTYIKSNFLTARTAARHYAESKSGVILFLSGPLAKNAGPAAGGIPSSWASIESLVRSFGVEIGGFGARAVGLRIAPMPETPVVQEIVGLHATGAGIAPEVLAGMIIGSTMLKRLPQLTEAANTLVFLASDHASGLTGTTINLSCGMIAD